MDKNKKDTIITEEVTSFIRNPVLLGTTALMAIKYTIINRVVKELHPRTKKPWKTISSSQIKEMVETLNFPLRKVSPEEVSEFREKGIPSFVMKVCGEFYYAKIPNNITFMSSSILGTHVCAEVHKECRRLSAASDEDGGCKKVRDSLKRIEDYPWITKGYQTFNTKCNSFRVVACEHYEKCAPQASIPQTERTHRKLAIAQYVWPDIKNLCEARARIEKNGREGFYY